MADVGHTLPDGMWEATKDDDLEAYLKLVDQLKQEAYKRQLTNSETNLGFTFVRSPVQRFLSGLEQIERLNEPRWEVSSNLSDALAKVECVVDSLLSTRVFFNVHIYPQAYLFDAWTKRGEYDIAITVLGMKDIDNLFRRFTGEKSNRKRVSGIEGTTLSFQAKDLPSALLVKICQLYQIDLLMLLTLGMEDMLCTAALSSHAGTNTAKDKSNDAS